METYLKSRVQKASDFDEDVILFSDVEVLRDLTTPNGPKKGQKFLKVTWAKLSDCLIFHLQSGKCRIVQYDGKNPPVWMGEHERAPVVTDE
jgi:hypothetical protein